MRVLRLEGSARPNHEGTQVYQSLSLARSADQTVQPLKPERNARARPASRPGNRDPGMRQASDPMLVHVAGSPAKRTTETKPRPPTPRGETRPLTHTAPGRPTDRGLPDLDHRYDRDQ